MKMYAFIMTLLILLSYIGCNEEDLEHSNCQNSCDNEHEIVIYSNIQGKVFINNSYFTEKGDTIYIYAITISKIDLNSNNWTISPDSILVPCNLTTNFRINNQRIVVSGIKKSCCELLTLPEIRVGYGCKFEITKISKF